MSIQEAGLYVALVSIVLPIVSVFLRRPTRLVGVAATLVCLSVCTYLLTLVRLLRIGPTSEVNTGVYALLAVGVPMLLSVYVVSTGIGRESPERSFRDSRWTFSALAFVGLVILMLLPRSSFVTGFDWDGGRGTVYLGSIGKAYVSYLLVGIVCIGYNLESTFRLASSDVRHHLRLPFLGLFAALAYFTYVLVVAILYSTIGVGKLFASGAPIAFASGSISFSFLRGGLNDVASPVSRRVVYSSFTAGAVGIYVLALAVVAQLATFTKWSPDEVVTLSFGFVAVIVACLLLLSSRFQRRLRCFIDRNFYVNRYDYRTQWSAVTRTFEDVVAREDALQRASRVLEETFLADAVTIALRNGAAPTIRPCEGKGANDGEAVLEEDSPLFRKLVQERRALLLDRRPADFEYIPIYAENDAWLRATASQIVAPLFDGPKLLGTVGLDRNDGDDPFTFEDVSLLDSLAAHIVSTLRSLQLADELAETRDLQLMAQWNSMILHDLKNYLSPLHMVARNLIKYRTRPDIAELAAGDIEHVVERMEALVRTLSELRAPPKISRQRIDVNRLIESTLCDMQVERRDSLQVRLDLQAELPILADETLLRRLLENLVNNSIDAMEGTGTLAIETFQSTNGGNGNKGAAYVQVCVSDTGCGIPEEFLRDKLFRPFATTKRNGMGLGLYQCCTIAQAHGGELKVESRNGHGTKVQVTLKAQTPPAEAQTQQAAPEPKGVSP